MRVSLSKGYTYIPAWNDNKKEPEASQVKVHCEFLRGIDLTATVSERDPENPELFYVKDFQGFCKSIDNLEVEVDGKKIVCGPKEVATLPGLAELYLEIRSDYNKRTAIDKKK